jgi:hypothetical protein
MTNTTRYRLVIGNKAWSSWSLRPWLAMRRLGLPFQEINVRLREPGSKAAILEHSPSGLVPTLLDGDLAVWDSLAILEYLAEQHPEAPMWPADRVARATARSISAEIHSGFSALRQSCSMDLFAPPPPRRRTARGRKRHPPHRGPVAALPLPLWQRRPISVLKLLGRRRDVCARRRPLPLVCAGLAPLRGRRDGTGVRRDHLRHAGDGGLGRRRACRAGKGGLAPAA